MMFLSIDLKQERIFITMENIIPGLHAEQTITVTKELLASNVGSGDCDVYATPMLVNFIENTAANLVKNHLSDPALTSVGTLINIQHLAATPEGMQVTAKVEITEVDRKRIVFTVEVQDAVDLICKGTHERFVVEKEKFSSKAKNKAKK